MMSAERLQALFAPQLAQVTQLCRQVEALVLCTEDGLSLATIGVSAEQVNALAAVASSLMVLSDNSFDAFGHSGSADRLLLESGHGTVIIQRLRIKQRSLFLMARSREAQLGVVIMAVSKGAAAIEAKFMESFTV